MENFENNTMKNAMDIRKELREKETYFSLLESAKKDIKRRESGKLLEKTPNDIFNQMEGKNEIRGSYSRLEFLKLDENDLAIAVTDIHGDRERLGTILEYIRQKKEEIKGDVHLISMGDIASGASESEDAEVLFDLLRGSRDGDFKLHLLQGNVERDVAPTSSLYKKVYQKEGGVVSFPAMTDLFKVIPNSLFLENGKIMLTHSTLPLVMKNLFEKEGLKIFDRKAEDIDKTGLRKYSETWATFDGEKEKSELGGKKGFQLGKDTFRSILGTLNLNKILRGHDSSLIKKKAKDEGVHKIFLKEGEVDTFHTSNKATGYFGIFAEITNDGKIEFKKV